MQIINYRTTTITVKTPPFPNYFNAPAFQTTSTNCVDQFTDSVGLGSS